MIWALYMGFEGVAEHGGRLRVEWTWLNASPTPDSEGISVSECRWASRRIIVILAGWMLSSCLLEKWKNTNSEGRAEGGGEEDHYFG